MKKIIAILLTLTLLFSTIGSISYAANLSNEKTVATMDFVTMSDLHYYPETLMSDSEAWDDFCKNTVKQFTQSEQMIKTAIETALKRNPGLKYILVPGDLTKDSEYDAHVTLAGILEKYEKKYGVEFIVTTGNHDINQAKSVTYENGKQEKARALQADEFDVVLFSLRFCALS